MKVRKGKCVQKVKCLHYEIKKIPFCVLFDAAVNFFFVFFLNFFFIFCAVVFASKVEFLIRLGFFSLIFSFSSSFHFFLWVCVCVCSCGCHSFTWKAAKKVFAQTTRSLVSFTKQILTLSNNKMKAANVPNYFHPSWLPQSAQATEKDRTKKEQTGCWEDESSGYGVTC